MIICLIVILVLAILFLIATYICYDITFTVPKKERKGGISYGADQYALVKEDIERSILEVMDIPYEQVSVKNGEGLTLCGRYYETAAGAPVHILFHGYRSKGWYDFAGRLQYLLRRGQNILLIDERAHEKSEGKCLTFGVKERFDVLAWARYVETRCGSDCKIVLSGVSMGAATVMMAADLDLPKGVVGIIADCGYSSPEAIIKKVITDMKYPKALTYAFIRLGGMIYGGFDLEKSSALSAVANTELPILFIHGDADPFVPYRMSGECYAVCHSEKDFYTVPGGGHGLAYVCDPTGYENAVDAFLIKLGLFGK